MHSSKIRWYSKNNKTLFKCNKETLSLVIEIKLKFFLLIPVSVDGRVNI